MGEGTQNSGGCSRSWEEDIYWTHFQFIHFTQFLRNSDFQQQLALPKTFSDNLKNKLPENVTLKGPSGVVWNIGLTARDDTVYFMDGWQQFVKDHSLKENDFLVFKYNGESLFQVLIFHGDSLCEKAASYFVRKCGQTHSEQGGNKGKNSNNSLEEVNTLNGSVECGSPEKSWEEDIYWTHFQFKHFTQFLRTDFEQQLALPKIFSDNLKKLPENVTLKGPSGVVWNIGLTTTDDTVYFADSWQLFVNVHSLKENDFLVFKYNGESHFEVLIFDGEYFCEKAASYFVGKRGHAQTEQGGSKAMETNNSVEEVNTPSNSGVECGLHKKFRHLNNIETPLVVPYETTNDKTFNAGIKSDSSEQFMADAVTKTTAIQFTFHSTGKRSKRRRRSPEAANCFERAHDWLACNKEQSEAANLNRSGKEDDHYILSSASPSKLSAYDEKLIALSFTSSFPYFVKIMKTFNVERPRILNIPYLFSTAHLPNCKIKIVLHNLKGERWTVNSVPRKRLHTSHILCGGWLDFVRDNSIKVGDVCIFELIRECELRVRIAEVGKDGLECQVGKLALSKPSARHDVASHRTSKYMPKKPKVSSKCRTKVDLSDEKLSKICQEAVLSTELKKSGRASNTLKKTGLSPKSKAAHKKSVKERTKRINIVSLKKFHLPNYDFSPILTVNKDSCTEETPREDELSSQANDSLRTLFARDEQRVAEAFTSTFPYFVKIMKKFNVCGSYTLKIPRQFSTAHLPEYNTEVTLRNSKGECWTVKSVPYVQGGATIHTFCGGWNSFVRDNDINFGDTCIFELVSDYVMQVHISGCGKEGLDRQNGNVKLNSATVPSTC